MAITFNFNMQGADMYNTIEWPVYNLLNSGSSTSIAPTKTTAYKLYPNPTNSIVHFQHPNSTNGSYKIFDIQGKLMRSYTFSTGLNTIDCSDLDKGIYTIKFKTDDQLTNQKLIIQ